MEYLINTEHLDNTVHEITYEQLELLYKDNLREAEESRRITASSYRGENYYTENGNLGAELEKEYLIRDPRTSGMLIYYPHGVIIGQAARRNYYRGENQLYPESIPTLLRSLKKYTNTWEKELYRLVSDMRIAEFKFFLEEFKHVSNWEHGDVLYEALAQHYGIETGWLDITHDFNVALFFATCYWDQKEKAWKPLTKKQTEVDENHKYGMIYHMPSNRMPMRWSRAVNKFTVYTDRPVGVNAAGSPCYDRLLFPKYKGEVGNLIYPLGFQPFMRCHMQSGYGIYMRTPRPLQMDCEFEKLKFRHSEELSQKVFHMMKGGKLVFPHEGLKQVQYIIDQISEETTFSEKAFQYALYRSHFFRIGEAENVRKEIQKFRVDGKTILIRKQHPWVIPFRKRQHINRLYNNFSIEKRYGIKIMDRGSNPSPQSMFEPWMIPEEHDGAGVEDFRVRPPVSCGSSILTRDFFNIMHVIKYAQLPDF